MRGFRRLRTYAKCGREGRRASAPAPHYPLRKRFAFCVARECAGFNAARISDAVTVDTDAALGAAPRSVRASLACLAATWEGVRLAARLSISVDAVSMASHICVPER
jgi:hypothetical protein